MRSRLALKVLSLVLAAALIATMASVSFRHPQGNDFRSFYRGAQAAASHRLAGLYSEQLDPKIPLDLPYIRTPLFALMLTPFTYLSFAPAYCLWIATQSAIFLWLLFQAQSTTKAAAIACFYPPVLLGIGHGQDCVLYLLILVVSYWLFRKDRQAAAGLVLGLGLLKFHLFLLWPAGLIVQKRWQALLGFCATGLIILGASIAVAGPHGFRDYCAFLLDPRLTKTTPSVEREVGIGALMEGMGFSSLPVQILLGLGVGALALYSLRGRSVEWLFVILPAASLAITPHALYYDPTMLLLSLWIAYTLPGRRALHRVALALASPVIFFATVLPPPWTVGSALGILAFLFLAVASAGKFVSNSNEPAIVGNNPVAPEPSIP